MNIKISRREISIGFPLQKSNNKNQVKTNKKFVYTLVFVLVLLSIGAWIFYYDQGLILAYNDARSRLNIARRIFDGLQPGLAQLGSVWLPLYHIFELPFIWSDFMWHSGIAGSIPSMIAFILGGCFLTKLTRVLKFDVWATIITFLVYATNPNLLFMQAIPMTESLLIFLSIAVVYYVVAWAKEENPRYLIAGGFFTLLSTMTRYDGWFLAMFATFAVAFIAYKKKGYKFAEGNTLLYVSFAGFGVALWFLWNWVIFGDPLFFALGPFSAKAQQDVLAVEGRLFTKGNLVYSFFLYLLTVRYNVGLWIGMLSLFGLWLFNKSKEYSTGIKIAVSLLLVPFIFNVFSLFIGHSVIHIPEVAPFTWFNDRYGLMVIPAVAVSVGYVANKRRVAFALALVVIVIQTTLMYSENRVITIEDGVKGASGDYLDSAGDWIGENVSEGLILVAASSNDALLFKSGLPLKRYILEGAQHYWQQALEDPTINAEWIIMHKGDLVYKSMVDNHLFLNNYKLVYKDEFTYIYKLDMGRENSLNENELPK